MTAVPFCSHSLTSSPAVASVLRKSLDRWVLFSTTLFLLTDVLGGLLRYLLGSHELALLAYLPKALLAGVAFFLFVSALQAGRISKLYAGALAVLASSLIVGVIYLPSVLQVLFGAWTLVPFLFGIVAYTTFQRHWPVLKPLFILMWLLAVGGVVLNSVESFPWIGYTYTLHGVVLESSRQWTAHGIERLAGFSEASSNAAAQVLILGGFIVTMSRGWGWRTFVWLASGAAIVLTTTKTGIGAYGILTLFLILRRVAPRLIWAMVAWLVALAVTVIPLSTAILHYDINTNSSLSRLLFASFNSRLTMTWPQALQLIAEHGSLMIGRGLGGIGAAQKRFEPLLYNPADNLFLYLLALFGVGAIVLVVMYAFGIARLELKKSHLDCFFYVVAMIGLLWGMTLNPLEFGFTALFLGLSARHMLVRQRATRRPSAPTPVAERAHTPATADTGLS